MSPYVDRVSWESSGHEDLNLSTNWAADDDGAELGKIS